MQSITKEMLELSLHILDIANNSVRAKASLVEILVEEEKLLTIQIKDDGCGMAKDFLEKVRTPYVTTKTTSGSGMGIPLFEKEAISCGGKFSIESEEGIGTTVTATFAQDHKNRLPMGNMAETMKALISGSPETDFVYSHKKGGQKFLFDTREIKAELENVPINTPKILSWIGEYICEGLGDISVSQ